MALKCLIFNAGGHFPVWSCNDYGPEIVAFSHNIVLRST